MIDGRSSLVNVLSHGLYFNSWSLFKRIISAECPEKVGFVMLDPCLVRIVDKFSKVE